MKGSPAMPGGLLTSKPTWSKTLGEFDHVGFFFRYGWRGVLTCRT
jgi:hypothetical protein